MKYCSVLSFTRNLQGQLPKLRLYDADAAEPAISFHAWMEFRWGAGPCKCGPGSKESPKDTVLRRWCSVSEFAHIPLVLLPSEAVIWVYYWETAKSTSWRWLPSVSISKKNTRKKDWCSFFLLGDFLLGTASFLAHKAWFSWPHNHKVSWRHQITNKPSSYANLIRCLAWTSTRWSMRWPNLWDSRPKLKDVIAPACTRRAC